METRQYSPQEHPKVAFAGMMSRMDRDVGRLLTKLDELGLDRNTLVIFISDNGAHREGGAAPYFFGPSVVRAQNAARSRIPNRAKTSSLGSSAGLAIHWMSGVTARNWVN